MKKDFQRIVLASLLMVTLSAHASSEASDGLLVKDGVRLFPIGFYELPTDPAALKAMAEAGVNLVHCANRGDLDRVQAVGMQGVVPLDLTQGGSEALRGQVSEMADHPALALWEGPDEVVWNFTAYSGLFKSLGVHKTQGAWWSQSPEAVLYAREKAAELIPKMREASALIRGIDGGKHPLWINEASRSDATYVRQYFDFVDITGCDIYPVHAKESPLERVGAFTQLWRQIGRDKPVYMVLQAFAWTELGDTHAGEELRYPTFAESRLMAWDAIARGARGILYWGSAFTKSAAFRESIYAVTRELAVLHPFLTAAEGPTLRPEVLETQEAQAPQVLALCRRSGDDWLVVVVNEDAKQHMPVVVGGLEALNGRTLNLLYGDETFAVSNGELTARILPYGVNVYATDRKWETQNRGGPDTKPEGNPN